MVYRYDSTDQVDVVEDAGYFNNLDDDLNLQIGDLIYAFTWSATPYEAGSTLSEAKQFVVTNVVPNDAAAAAGAVNVAEVFIATGLLSSQG
jgi:hypothetical protein